jgi:DNA-directed RNA polymerase alpha subunit
MPPKTTWTDDEKKAHSEKSMRARIEAAAAYKGCTAEELAAMPERELLKLQNLGRKTVDFLQNPGRGDPLQSPNPRKP